MHFPSVFSLWAAALGVVSALPNDLSERDSFGLEARTQFPFDRIVAFGDDLSDNGNGSFAHGVQDPKHPNNTIYGYRTWTNGPVAVSYLSTLLGVPLTEDYAYGGADGGSKVGATINVTYTGSMYAQDGFQQVANYTSSPGFKKSIAAKTLHFIWIGNNDISLKHIYLGSSSNPKFAADMSRMMTDLVGRLISAGAKNVFVVGLYPKQITPGSVKNIAHTQQQIANLAAAIKQANTAIKKSLVDAYGSKIIYFDAYTYMLNLYNNAAKYGINYVLPHFCDPGSNHQDWQLCVTDKRGDEFYWMNYIDPTTHVHSLVAGAMSRTINSAFA